MTPPLRPAAVRSPARGGVVLLSLLLAALSVMAAGDPADAAPPAPNRAADTALEPLARLLQDLPAAEFPCLQDRGLPLAPLDELDGSSTSRAVSARLLRQVADDLARMAAPGELTGDPAAFRVRARAATDVVPLGLIRATTSRLASDALTRGDLVLSGDRLLATGAAAATRERVVAAGALADHSHRGQATFVLRRELVLGNEPLPALVEIDFDDGRGWRTISFDEPISVRWTREGTRTFRWRVTSPDGDVDHARSTFDVAPLGTPVPDDTLQVTGVQSWQGATGTGDGYVYLAPGHATITNPAIVLEGFDLDDTMYWEELYVLLNQQNLLEDLRTDGYDAVVLNFTQATDPIPRNAFVAVDLIQQVLATIDPQQDVFVIGASMGGLVGRYALSWMEQQAIPHRTRTFLTYDTPHDGANIPLGIQYWLSFFSGLSSEASFLLGRLDTPAARQMLVVHHTDPPDGTPEPDPARAQFLADLAAVGDWPALPRKVAIANGSASNAEQGFSPGTQVIQYVYNSFLVDIRGNVWALPPLNTSAKVFEGRIDYLIGNDQSLDVIVFPPRQYDGAPGGWRDSMAQMDAVPAPFGDIIALYPNHCFVPTISSLALNVTSLYHDVANDPNLLSLTPVDAVYFPIGPNEEHVFISAQASQWVRDEISAGATDAPFAGVEFGGAPTLAAPRPNPASRVTEIPFTTSRTGRVQLEIVDVTGRRVATLTDAVLPAGAHRVRWADDSAPAGVYFARVRTDDGVASRRFVRLR